MSEQVYNVNLPDPTIGNKMWLAEKHGIYVLERGPCTLRSIANTRQGNGSIFVYDGVPDETGHFPSDVKKVLELAKNGRKVFNASPPILGMWMFDGGLYHGCTLVLQGSNFDPANKGLPPCVAITWAAAKPMKRKIENV